ncbi:glycine zipper 2TM domain-containing protein [Massilia sp. W12]|uniref:glycine zipper 2TM domain-containing protein n=1 Tax=Massilia sp. W12 TaxID=3126507 RepID=UPI0030CD0DFE
MEKRVYVTPPAQSYAAPVAYQAPAYCNNCGVVQSVRRVSLPAGSSGVGAVTGAVVGGIIGNQIGGGDGRKIATVAGVVAGGIIGDAIERDHSGNQVVYETRIKMEGGGEQTMRYAQHPGWRQGQAVVSANGAWHSR